jgi:hypothetical protein
MAVNGCGAPPVFSVGLKKEPYIHLIPPPVPSFQIISSPHHPVTRGGLEEALCRLYVLDALDDDGDISQLGRQMANMPLEPALARALLAAHRLGWVWGDVVWWCRGCFCLFGGWFGLQGVLGGGSEWQASEG